MPLLALGFVIHPIAGIALGLLSAFVVMAILSAAQAIFISAIYHKIKGDPVQHFNDQFVENLFVYKS